MDTIRRMLLGNQAWVEDRMSEDPGYFERLARPQQPEVLWIGCSDSRVPPDEITGTNPGDMFVHRNIANLVIHTDLNLLSVLHYAVGVLKVKHVVVCGHYGCGGVNAAMTRSQHGLLNKWLRHIKDVYHVHRSDVDQHAEHAERLDRLVEINVAHQVMNLAKSSIIQEAWHKRQLPVLHGWVFSLADGRIREVTQRKWDDPLDDLYRYDFNEER